MSIDVLTVSSKGQIVLPAEIRKALSINTGDKLAIFASDDVIMLKTVKVPSVEDFKTKLDEAQKWAKQVGYVESDVNEIIKDVRKKKENNEDSCRYKRCNIWNIF